MWDSGMAWLGLRVPIPPAGHNTSDWTDNGEARDRRCSTSNIPPRRGHWPGACVRSLSRPGGVRGARVRASNVVPGRLDGPGKRPGSVAGGSHPVGGVQLRPDLAGLGSPGVAGEAEGSGLRGGRWEAVSGGGGFDADRGAPVSPFARRHVEELSRALGLRSARARDSVCGWSLRGLRLGSTPIWCHPLAKAVG